LAGVGLLCVGLAAVGAVVPGLPTTVFLIAASYCFARSCPWLEERLLRGRLFASYMTIVSGRCPIPPRARWTALLAMWMSIVFSLGMLRVGDTLTHTLTAVIVAAGFAGTIAIIRYRRGPGDMGPA
jgi:uncharacterized membrane protein YbaN (DUF454 family)